MSTKESELYISDTDIEIEHSLVLYNSLHVYDDVVNQLHKATGYDLIQCEQIAIIAHTKGKAVVKSGEIPSLQKINSVLKEIDLVTEIV